MLKVNDEPENHNNFFGFLPSDPTLGGSNTFTGSSCGKVDLIDRKDGSHGQITLGLVEAICKGTI